MTSDEYRLRCELEQASREIDALRSRVLELQTDVEKLQSSRQVDALEIQKLTLVCQRDLKRVEAELAMHIARAADLTQPERSMRIRDLVG
jgi:hypothetical protein